MTVDSYLRRMTRIPGAKAKELLARAQQRGQAMVEFAMIATLALVVLLVGIQFALIGQAALAVSQASYLGARAASINETLTSSSLQTAIQSQMSPTINGASVTLTNTSDSTCTAGSGGSRSYGCPITVTVTYDATNKLFLPSNTLMGITFPTNLTATESAMTE